MCAAVIVSQRVWCSCVSACAQKLEALENRFLSRPIAKVADLQARIAKLQEKVGFLVNQQEGVKLGLRRTLSWRR
jgi:hypothetical protein